MLFGEGGNHPILQDWRKGRRAEIQEMNGLVVDKLKAAGKDAPMDGRVVEVALEIESGRLAADTFLSKLLIDTLEKTEAA